MPGAQKRDPWPGEYPAYDGTTVQAGVEEMIALGWADSAEWGSTSDEVITLLFTRGPVIVGTIWTDTMSTPDSDGYLHPTGDVAGGHGYLLWKGEITSGTSASNAKGTVWMM